MIRDIYDRIWLPILAMCLVILLMSIAGRGMQETYGQNQCELIAKDYQKEYYGNLVFIQPLTQTGTYDLGFKTGHFMNRAYQKNKGLYYHDYDLNATFQTRNEVLEWYYDMTGKKAAMFVLGEDNIPFPMRYFY